MLIEAGGRLKWSRELPLVRGYYWNRSPVDKKPQILMVKAGRDDEELYADGYRLSYFSGDQWAGPIEEPTDE